MRIRIVKASDICKDGIAEKTCQALAEEFGRDSSITLTDENPDVIHIVGAWDASSMSIANDAAAKFIAWMHTPLGSLSPWHKPSNNQLKLSGSAPKVIASGTMEKELLQDTCKENLKIILNAVTTNTTSMRDMAASYLAVYQEVCKSMAFTLQKHLSCLMKPLLLDDENITFILHEFIYAQYLYKKGNLPKLFLDSLAQQMTQRNYDENRMAELFKQMGIYEFSQRLEYVMQEQSSLTEGFMPVPMLCDKEAKNMTKLITNY